MNTHKAMSKKELCALYNVSLYVLNKWLEKIPAINAKGRKTFNPAEVTIIKEHLG